MNSKNVEYLLPLSSKEYEFDVDFEVRRALVDQIRAVTPTTVLGVLLANETGIKVAEIADLLRKPIGLVGWRIEKLEEDDLCVRIRQDDDDETSLVRPFAPFGQKND